MTKAQIAIDFKVGDKRCGGSIIEIHEEVGNNYAVVECDICGCKTKSIYNRLKENYACKCQKTKGMVEKAKERKEKQTGKVAIGDIIKNREILEIFIDAHGKTAVKLKCELCGRLSNTAVTEISNNPHSCVCQGFTNAQATLEINYGVSSVAHIPGVMERVMETKVSNNIVNGFRSKGEQEIFDFVESTGLEPIHYASRAREIDIFVKDLKIGIEYNGIYWHSEEKRPGTTVHINKKKLFIEEGIDLIQIWDYQWLTRKNQVMNYLRSRLHKNTNIVGARKCQILVIDKETARDFVNKYHIQRSPNFNLAVGAFYQGELISVATFGIHHRGSGEKTLNRLCSKENWTCSGFLGKAVKLAFSIINEPIVTWVDRCLSEGESYIKAGFVKTKVTKPSYFYGHSKKGIISKQSFRRKGNQTEAQRAKSEGMFKVWDCGKIRFVYGKSPQ